MKNSSLLIRTVIIVVITLVGIYLVFGPRGSVSAKILPGRESRTISPKISISDLDLKGGSHLGDARQNGRLSEKSDDEQ